MGRLVSGVYLSTLRRRREEGDVLTSVSLSCSREASQRTRPFLTTHLHHLGDLPYDGRGIGGRREEDEGGEDELDVHSGVDRVEGGFEAGLMMFAPQY